MTSASKHRIDKVRQLLLLKKATRTCRRAEIVLLPLDHQPKTRGSPTRQPRDSLTSCAAVSWTDLLIRQAQQPRWDRAV